MTGDQFVEWLYDRHPETLAASTFKRGKSTLSQFLKFAIARNWAEADVLKPLELMRAKPSDARRDWLRPEQIAALNPLVTSDDFDDDQIMWWRVMLDAGLRVEELVELQPRCLEPLELNLALYEGTKGKKLRDVPVSPDFCEAWTGYVAKRQLKPLSWMFPLSGQRFQGGGDNERVVLDSKRHVDQKAVRAMLERLQDKASQMVRDGVLQADLLPTFKLGPHTLRRTYACSNLIMSELLGPGHGLDLRSLQEAMGHESLGTTASYLADVASYLNRHRRPRSITSVAGELADRHGGESQENQAA